MSAELIVLIVNLAGVVELRTAVHRLGSRLSTVEARTSTEALEKRIGKIAAMMLAVGCLALAGCSRESEQTDTQQTTQTTTESVTRTETRTTGMQAGQPVDLVEVTTSETTSKERAELEAQIRRELERENVLAGAAAAGIEGYAEHGVVGLITALAGYAAGRRRKKNPPEES